MMEKRGDDDLADLAAELLGTGFSAAQVLKVIKAGRAGKGGPEIPHDIHHGADAGPGMTAKGQPRRFNHYITHETVLAAMLAAGREVTVDDIMKRLDARYGAISRHFQQGAKLGNIMTIGKAPPFHYRLTKAGERIASNAKPPPTNEEPLPGETRRVVAVIGFERVIAALEALGHATAAQVRNKVGVGTDQAIRMHLRKGVQRGIFVQHETTPQTYSKAGYVPSSRTVPAASIGNVTNEEVVEAVRTLGKATAAEVHKALDYAGSRQSIYDHLGRAAKAGKLTKYDDTNPATFGIAISKAHHVAKKQSEAGDNTRDIVSALKAAGKPLTTNEFVTAVPRFKTMQRGAIYMALSNARKIGDIVRIETGIYGLPPAKKVTEGKARAPDEQADRRATVDQSGSQNVASNGVQLSMVN